ncbi:MAG: flagellar basal body P-ring formation protein FlgA [Alphaproteobacteria bacterium]|nr:flagellar basal body P-ring formation protein FlgA [Alphaproteobacteria bacterium]
MKKMSITRQCLAIIILALCILFAISYPGNATSITLKQDAIVTDNALKLGDIFDGLPHSADKVLGVSPRPGKDMVLNARTLLRIALALDLPWKPASAADYVTVHRAATLVDRDTIERALKEELTREGLSGDLRITIPAEKSEIILPASEPARMEIASFNLHRNDNWFEAQVVAPSRDNPVYRTKISGTYERLVNVPVLRDAIRGGTIIGQRDIDVIQIPERHLSSDIILSAENLIGTTPRRTLTAGNPIKAHDIESPKIVERGEYVTVKFSQGPLQLTTRAKALENGAKGDTIRVVNMSSNKTLEAVVTASQEVTLRTF